MVKISATSPRTTEPELSVVVPIYNEDGNIAPLHKELAEVLGELEHAFEIIYVNDGSSDDSLERLREITKKDFSYNGAAATVVVISLARRYGQATALDAGFKKAKGEIIISMDGDGQNDPHDIPKLLRELEEKNLDVVAGWRMHRSDRRGIKVITRAARGLRKLFIDDEIHDSGCTLRVYRREALENLDLHGEMHRYILALLRWKGFRIGELAVNDRPRKSGKSKYGYGKAVRGFIDLIYVWFLYKYSDRPFHFFGYLGLFSFALAIVSFFVTGYQKFALATHVNRNGWFFLTFFFLLMAIMLFSFGIIIDLLLRIYYNTSAVEKRYVVREVIGGS
jgi:glycosyltransferase involved in cell wall biosynthesis